ncbi:preprotein translocase subunit YajC [Microbacterium sp. NPDC096154]|uniref:preprotein translocase subunit YajC n=1 Tax=Microbacterium sp. NPDC096154 TaxID=3155549 RepID=UPI0033224495
MDPNLLLLLVVVVMLVWMFFSSRRRQQKMREEQARKAELMVPGARVMSRSGLYGSLVEFDSEDLSKPAKVEIAPGVVIEMHTQAIDLAPEDDAAAAEEQQDAAEAEEAPRDSALDEGPADAAPAPAASDEIPEYKLPDLDFGDRKDDGKKD